MAESVPKPSAPKLYSVIFFDHTVLFDENGEEVIFIIGDSTMKKLSTFDQNAPEKACLLMHLSHPRRRKMEE